MSIHPYLAEHMTDDEMSRRTMALLDILEPQTEAIKKGNWYIAKLPVISSAQFQRIDLLTTKTTSFLIVELEVHDGKDWLHLSYSREKDVPSWKHLTEAKETFIPRLHAMQIIPVKEEYVNIHPYCLHLYARADGSRGGLPDFRRGGGI